MAWAREASRRDSVDDTETERYRATIGVQISKKEVVVGNQSVTMAIWDVADLDHL